eukprot:c11169_g1_i1 orf=486-4829(+)
MAWSNTISCLGPAFLVYVGCMDPGKWATALEGGSRFGLELVWLMIAACVFAAFLQSLSSRLGLATGRNLAQICSDEYPRYLSVLLWFQCEVSVLILDVTMVLGIGMTLNALLGLSMVSSVVIAAVESIIFLMALPYLGLYKAELFTASIMGVVLLCFSVETLHSNAASTPAILQGLIPRLKGDMLYIAAGILGANIIPCNFYLHSALVQDEKQSVNYEPDVLLHHNIIDIATGSGVTLLINLAVLSSATAAFHNCGHVVITLQDAQALMEQVLSSSVAPAAFGFALLCAGQLSSSSLIVAGQVATEGFLGFKLPLSFHRVFTRLGAALIALCLVWCLGSEGTYQVLIFSQVILALQLPFAIVPLLKVTSSQAVMGSFRNSLLAESISWVCTGLIYIMNIWVAFDTFFGESEEYVGSGNWNLIWDLADSSASWREAIRFLSLITVIGVTTIYTLLLMWMMSAPFKAEGAMLPYGSVSSYVGSISGHLEGSQEGSTIERDPCLPAYAPMENYSFAEDLDTECHEAVWDSELSLPRELNNEPLLGDAELSGAKSMEVELGEIPDAPPPQQQVSEKETVIEEKVEATTCSAVQVSKEICLEPHKDLEQQKQPQSNTSFSFVDSSASVNSSSRDGFLSWAVSPPDSTIAETDNQPAVKVYGGSEAERLKGGIEDVDLELLDKDDYDTEGWDTLDQDDALQDSLSVLGGSVNSLTFEEPESGRSFSARSDASEGSCGGSGSGSLSRLSGLGRSARRQFASFLDEFWGKLYDLHGQPISQTHGKSRGASTKTIQSDTADHHSVSAYKEAFGPDSTWYTSKLAQKSWQKNLKGHSTGQIDAYLRPSYNGVTSDTSLGGNDPFLQKPSPLDVNERRYLSLRYPSFRDSFDNQPATIHGYKMASYAGRNGSSPTGVDASSFLLERQRQLMQRSSDEQALSASSFYRHQALPSSEQENIISTSSVQSFLSSPYAKQSLGRQFENFSLTNKSFATQMDRPDPYSRSQLTSYTGRDSATWDPLVYRATGELDVPRYDHVALQRDKDRLSSSFAQHRTGERGYFGTSSNNSNHLKSQIDRGPLSFDEISPSQVRKDAFSIQSASQNQSLWASPPFEQLFGSARTPIGSGRAATRSATNKDLNQNGSDVSTRNVQVTSVQNYHDIEVLNMLRLCIRKLLKLDGSEWLFRLESGSDEDLIGTVAAREKVLLDADTRELQKLHASEQLWASNCQRPLASSNSDLVSLTSTTSGVPHCGEDCVWTKELLISFGVWCVHRVLELALMESRPELWGKYTYVLNRLQGVLDPAFSKPRIVLMSCICVISEAPDGQARGLSKQGSLKDGGIGDLLSRSLSGGISGNSYQGYPQSWPWGRNSSTCKGKGASSSIFLEIIKDVETAIGTRKGRTGTAAGDVAFPKGKENLASVLKRYKRRLGNKSPSTPANGSSNNSGNRRAPASSPSIFM